MAQQNVSRALVENIYFSAAIWAEKDQYKHFFSEKIEPKFADLRRLALNFETQLLPGYTMLPYGIPRYEYGINVDDKYRIFFARNFGDNHPIYIIVGAQHMHTNPVAKILDDVKNSIEVIIKSQVPEFKLDDLIVKLSRVDICNHNNFIDIQNYIKHNELNSRAVTRITDHMVHSVSNGQDDVEVDYIRYGTGNVVVRLYNKTKEVIEMKQKPFFFPLWKDNGLIDEHTYNVYEQCYKMHSTKMNYKACFMAANIIASNAPEHIKELAAEIHKDPKRDNEDKYDELSQLMRKNNLEMCYELTNVEFQLRSEFLKSVNIVYEGTDVKIDFTDVDNLLQNVDILYRYLTNDVFRVVVRKQNTKVQEKRKRGIDKLWQLIQSSQVVNIDTSSVNEDNRKVYRTYNTTMSELKTLERVKTAASHLFYLTSNNVNLANVDTFSITDIINNIKKVNAITETYFNDADLLLKQIHRHGEKKINRKVTHKIKDCRKYQGKLKKQHKNVKFTGKYGKKYTNTLENLAGKYYNHVRGENNVPPKE